MKENPILLEVFKNRFSSISEEMGVTLNRTAFSPNIKERRDSSCAIFDRDGAMIAQAAHIPVHLGSMPMSVKSAIENVVMEDGDMVILNDPFKGGTHLPDITVVAPVFAGENRSNNSYVRQVSPPLEGIIQDDHVSIFHDDILNGRFHRHGHRAQVDRDMCRLGDHRPIPVKDGTRRITSLLNIWGKGSSVEGNPHFFRNRRKSVFKDFQQNRVFFHYFLHSGN